MTDRELMQMALDALEKLADETPTTHVRVGKAKTVEGKEIVALWFDDCSDPLQQAMYINATKPEKLKLFLKQVRDRLAQPEPTGREIQKIMQSAWKAVSNQYKDDPECCFALGWEAGYGAVAPKVEPPETESGEGFESLPAPSIKQPELGVWLIQYQDRHEFVFGKKPEFPSATFLGATVLAAEPLYTAPPKREWVGLTDEDIKDCESWCGDQHDFAYEIEAKLKEKNGG